VDGAALVGVERGDDRVVQVVRRVEIDPPDDTEREDRCDVRGRAGRGDRLRR
jgi:hypothetical protein